ncbi:MAG: NERD domain-containing protein [Candidatus Bathyarchaeota archaeon]|nr:NERD domain-containing protein [Candidatus Bathyarchaeota archaeon]
MAVERNLLISLLKLTKSGSVLIENVKQDSHVTTSIAGKLLENLQKEGAVYLKNGAVEADSYGRLKIAVRALTLGADVESVSNLLHWQEFEEIAAVALERNGYVAAKNVRFKSAGRRWEIDVVGCKRPLVLCIDCKHWHHGMSPSALKRIVEAQAQRTRALAESLPSASLKIECAKWKGAKFVPAVLSLVHGSFKFYEQVPIVPVLQLQDFLNQLPAYADSLKVFTRNFEHLRHDL